MSTKARRDITIMETKDYGMFNKLLGNRGVTPARVKSIKESILRVGYHPSPILVNENYEVIDGQGRLAALQALDMPVLFIKKPGLTVDDCISMNIKMKNWSQIDYIRSWAERGNPNYVRLLNLMDKYPKLEAQVILLVCGFVYGSGSSEKTLQDGGLQIRQETYEMHETLRWLSSSKPYLGKTGKPVLLALARLDKFGLIDKTRMLESISKYHASRPINARSTNDIIAQLNDIYNYNRTYRVYFADDYKRLITKKEKA